MMNPPLSRAAVAMAAFGLCRAALAEQPVPSAPSQSASEQPAPAASASAPGVAPQAAPATEPSGGPQQRVPTGPSGAQPATAAPPASVQPPAASGQAAPTYGAEPPPPTYGPPYATPPAPPGQEAGAYPAFEPPPPRQRFRERRASDTVVLMGGISLYDVFGIGIGGNIGFYVTPDTIIEIDGWEGAAAVPRVTSQSMGVRVVQFVSDVFYVRGGPRYRHIEIDDDVLGIEFEEHDDFVAQKDAGLSIGLGSRWQWSAFTLGLDFLDVYVPAVAFETKTLAVDRVTDRVVFEGDAETRRTLDVRFARFEIGASF